MISGGRLVSPEVRIETTTRCNANCTICPREKLSRPLTTMPYAAFTDIVDQCYWLGARQATLFGYGEPLLDPDIHLKIAYCTFRGIDTTITTNASLLTEKTAHKLLDAGLTEIRFSCHGFGPDYEDIHRPLKWQTTIRNILNFLYMNETCKTNVSVIPLHNESIDTIKEFWEPQVDYLEIWRPHNWTDGREFRKQAKKKKTCGRPFSGPAQINADGKMMVCCFDYDAKLTIGDTSRNSVKDILGGDELARIKRKHESGDLSGLICESCDQLNIEDVSPLLYSSRDMELGKTSTFKVKIGD